jgi:hypothetical protein
MSKTWISSASFFDVIYLNAYFVQGISPDILIPNPLLRKKVAEYLGKVN